MSSEKQDQNLPGKIFNGRTYYVLSSANNSAEEPVVVCVHGIGSYHGHFDGLSAELVKQGFTVLRYDLFGRGYSPFPTNTIDDNGNSIFGAHGHITQMRELITGLGIDKRKFHLVGHSMGGALAVLYASQFGADEVLSLTLLSPAGLMNLGPLSLVRRCSCLHGFVRNMLRNSGEKPFRDDFYLHTGASLEIENKNVAAIVELNRQHPHIFEAFWQSALHFPLSDIDTHVMSLAKMHHIRTFIMWGDYDLAVPIGPSFERYQKIYNDSHHPDVTTKVFKNAAHGFFLEYPDEFNTTLAQFLLHS